MKKRSITVLIMAAVLSLSALSGCSPKESAAPAESAEAPAEAETEEESDWEPSGPITFVAAAAAGSGFDTSARNFAQVFNSTGIVKQSVKVVNDAGGAGQVGFTNFAHNYEGSDEAIIVASTATITGSVANEWEVTAEDFTPIAKLVVDAFVMVCAENNEKYDTIDKITQALKADPHSIKFGAAAPPDPDYIGFVLYLQEIGVDIADIEYVVYDGGGESIPALMGGHIDVAISTVSEFSSAVEAGQVKPIVVASEERMGGVYADTPTFVENGIDLTYGNWRGFWGPKDMPDYALKYWQNVAKQMVETDEWVEVCENMQWTSEPVIDGCKEWVDEFQADIVSALKAADIIE